uniref:Bcl-2 Bcl-2 homology region 1-3 domain-containing protein n=1 Tax=Periophthalmus magnuspinnatus TaxID=409849 RepID=A0A3B4B2U1_9GOBI
MGGRSNPSRDEGGRTRLRSDAQWVLKQWCTALDAKRTMFDKVLRGVLEDMVDELVAGEYDFDKAADEVININTLLLEDVIVVTFVAESVFEDGVVNWGRIIAMMVFGAALGRKLQTAGQEHAMEKVVNELVVFFWKNYFSGAVQDRREIIGKVTAVLRRYKVVPPLSTRVKVAVVACLGSLGMALGLRRWFR